MTLAEYVEWAKENLGSDFTSVGAEYLYSSNQLNCLAAIEQHPFFADLADQLRRADEAYRASTGFDLVMDRLQVKEGLVLDKKLFKSAVEKTYRFNCVSNTAFPGTPPPDGWYTPDNWFERINDLLRTTIVCKYLDAPPILIKALGEHADRHHLPWRPSTVESENGYYAHNFRVQFPATIARMPHLTTYTANVWVEIQVTTQLQDILYKLTHPFYEQRRVVARPDNKAWKWETKSLEFKVSYLGHTLHMLEGIIEQLLPEIRQPEAKATADADKGTPS